MHVAANQESDSNGHSEIVHEDVESTLKNNHGEAEKNDKDEVAEVGLVYTMEVPPQELCESVLVDPAANVSWSICSFQLLELIVLSMIVKVYSLHYYYFFFITFNSFFILFRECMV
jgi:hypothetical protein